MRNPYDTIGRIGLLLAIVGAINWLLVGIFQWNLVKWIFTQSGTQTVANTGERIVYVVVGVGGVLAIPMLAATLARARSARDERYAGERARTSDQNEDYDAGFASASGATAERGPVRRTERVIIRTEEPLTGSGQDVASAERAASTEGTTSTTDRNLSYGTVEEADDEYDTGTGDRRAA